MEKRWSSRCTDRILEGPLMFSLMWFSGCIPEVPAPEAVDWDRDGHSQDDCDDTDPSIHPGAPDDPDDDIDQDCSDAQRLSGSASKRKTGNPATSSM